MLKQALLKSLAVNAEESLADVWSILEQKQITASTANQPSSINKSSGYGNTGGPPRNEEIIGPADFEKLCIAMKMNELSFLQRFPVSNSIPYLGHL